MSLTIGRVELDCPYNIVHEGDRLSFLVDVDGYLTGASLDVAKVYRQQLLGLVDNPDEPVVPITWSDDSDWDGYYQIGSVQIVPTEVYLTDGYVRHFTVAVSATRVSGGFADATNELFCLLVGSTDLTTGDAVSADPFAVGMVGAVWVPATHPVTDWYATDESRSAADVDMYQVSVGSLGDAESQSFGLSTTPAPADHYDGSCVIESYVGGAYVPVVGRQVPSEYASTRVSNGMVRAWVNDSGEVEVENWDGTTWRNKTYDLTYDSGAATIEAPVSMTVLRNSPDMVTVRFTCPRTGSDDTKALLSFSVRRGEPMVEILATTHTSEAWKLTRATTEAATALTDHNSDPYAVRATSNDANGNRYVIVSRDVATADTTNGGLTFTASADPGFTAEGTPTSWGDDGFAGTTSTVIGVGMEIGGSSASEPNDADSLGRRFQIVANIVRSVVA